MIPQLLIHPDKETQIQTAEQQLERLQVEKLHPDVLWVEPDREHKSLGVKEAKLIREHFTLKPFQAPGRAAVIISAENLTLEAQNSLLKLLEELAEKAQLIMTAAADSYLLPTILSRCQIRFLPPAGPAPASSSNLRAKYTETAGLLPKLSLEERFKVVEQTEDKELLLRVLTESYSGKFRRSPQLVNFSKELIQAEEYREANGNLRTILEYLMLLLPEEKVPAGDNEKITDA